MVHPYNEIYLGDAMYNLAEAMDVAAYVYEFDLDYFMNLFIHSGLARQYETGNPKYLSGRSGTELVSDVLYIIYGNDSKYIEDTTYRNPTPEYWVGWILAYYQWESARSFKDIQKKISMETLLQMYYPNHEADESRMVDIINSRFAEKNMANRLQAYRKRLGLSQSELANLSDVNIRTLQQYEIGAKDIRKASAATVLSLSNVLKCDVKDLMQG